MNKTIKKILIGLAAIIILVVLAASIYVVVKSKDLPIGVEGPAADRLAEEVMSNLNFSAWENTAWVSFTFMGKRSFLWNKEENKCRVSWGDQVVILNLNQLDQSVVLEGDSDEKTAIIDEGWSIFCNDSYWLIAPFKMFDPGTKRSLVPTEEGEALLITYDSGGVTPGDSYLWFFDENKKPARFEMWVDISPIKGQSATWEGWISTETGFQLATKHDLGAITLEFSNIRTGNQISDVNLLTGQFSK